MVSMYKYQKDIQNIEVTYVQVKSVGVVSSFDVISSISPGQAFLITPMISKNKSRDLQTVANVAARVRELQVLFHTDVAYAIGKSLMDLRGPLI